MNQWHKNIATWRMGQALYVSVPFTWLLPEARRIASEHSGPAYAGGPAVDLMPEQMQGVATLGEPCPVPPLAMHNPLATFTTRGCPNGCPFCAVPRIEGDLVELEDWPVRPVVCDNNLLAASRRHFDRVIDRLKALPHVDFNQGLEARLFTAHHARRIAELRSVKLRFAFDQVADEAPVADAIPLARKHGLRDIGCYVLIGFHDTPECARYRLETLREWDIWPNPMRFQPLDSLEKDSHVGPAWTERELRRMMRYYSRLRWLEHIPYKDYRPPMAEGQTVLFSSHDAERSML
ncbi:MAG: hypothetical protein V5A84_04275, partial [Planctomycetota bacterium]